MSLPRPPWPPSLLASLALSLGGCSHNAPPADPQQARACFATHQASLPAGSQFEGATEVGGNIRVRVMDGTALITVECPASGKPNP
jgi:hypothetical protein